MGFSKLFLAFTIISLGAQMPVRAAGLKSKALVGAFVAAGSALATGAIELAKTFKNNSEAHVRATRLENELNWRFTRKLMDSSFNDGLVTGFILSGVAALIIIYWDQQPESFAPQAVQCQDLLNTGKQEAIKA